jgi:hypothetical protein
MYERILSGKPVALRVHCVSKEREALVTKYRELYAARPAEAVIARARARWPMVEISALRAIRGESLRETQRRSRQNQRNRSAN